MKCFVYRAVDGSVFLFQKESLRDAQEFAVRCSSLTDFDCQNLLATGNAGERGLVHLRGADPGHIRSDAHWNSELGLLLYVAAPAQRKPWWKFW